MGLDIPVHPLSSCFVCDFIPEVLSFIVSLSWSNVIYSCGRLVWKHSVTYLFPDSILCDFGRLE